MTEVVFSARGITKTYRVGEIEVHALRDVDLDLYRGEFVVLLGPSGCGKSTLLNILGGLDVPSSGRISFLGHDLGKDDDHARPDVVLGMSLAVAILIVGYYFVDAIDYLGSFQFRSVQREDMTVLFHDPRPSRAHHEVAALPGVLRVEPFRVVPPHRLMRKGDSLSGAFLRVDAASAARLNTELKHMPAVARATTRLAALRGFEETLARSLNVFTTVLVTFAAVIAAAMVYNAARARLHAHRGVGVAARRTGDPQRRRVRQVEPSAFTKVSALGVEESAST
jgi:energy-coupling factor transporter ATP-binding protein EcfA2